MSLYLIICLHEHLKLALAKHDIYVYITGGESLLISSSGELSLFLCPPSCLMKLLRSKAEEVVVVVAEEEEENLGARGRNRLQPSEREGSWWSEVAQNPRAN